MSYASGMAEPRNGDALAATCPGCGARYGSEAWSSRPLVEVLRHRDVRHVILTWPWAANVALVIRRCRCGAGLLRREARDESREKEAATRDHGREDGEPCLKAVEAARSERIDDGDDVGEERKAVERPEAPHCNRDVEDVLERHRNADEHEQRAAFDEGEEA